LTTIIVYRALTWEKFKIAVINSVRTTAMVMILIACAGAFAYLLTFYQVPNKMSEMLVGISENPVVILLMINLMLLLLGMIMDMAALILICTPIFLPIAISIGVDPYQFGMILLMNLGLGLCTPPVGACLFVGCAVGNVKIEDSVRTIWPFYIGILVALMMVCFIPAISLTLPNLLG
jgi:tripartite ATP-independent transporter DctM subunit